MYAVFYMLLGSWVMLFSLSKGDLQTSVREECPYLV